MRLSWSHGSHPPAVRRNTRLGGTVLGVLIGTLVATLFALQLALGVHGPRPFNFARLLAVTFGARWMVRRRAIASRLRDRERRS